MTQRNGHNPYSALFDLPEVSPEQVKQARRRLRLVETEFRLKRLEGLTKLVEAASAPDYWASLVYDRVERMRGDPWAASYTSASDRRHGRNYPIFQTEQELALIRMQARILCSTNSYAIGLLEGLSSYVLGDGLTYRAVSRHQEEPAPEELLAAVQDVIDDYLDRNQWHGGTEPGLEDEAFWRSCEDGEFFLVHYAVDEGHTEVRFAEPEQVVQPPGKDFGEWGFGIHTEPQDVAKPLGYWINWDATGGEEGDEYGPEQVLHFRRNVKRNIKRGITDFSFDAMDAFHVAGKLCRNMALGAAIQATYAGVRQHVNSTKSEVEGMQDLLAEYTQTNPVTGRTDHYQRHEPGMVDIPAGMSYANPPTATNAAAHVEILQACLRRAGVRWDAPEWLTSGLHDTSSFASSLTAESPFLKTITRRQRGYCAVGKQSCWIAVRNRVAHADGLLVRLKVRDGQGQSVGRFSERRFTLAEIRRLVDIEVKAPNPQTRNKLEDAQADQVYLQNKVKSPQLVAQELGVDAEQVMVDWEEWTERTGGQGAPLPLPGDGPPTTEAVQEGREPEPASAPISLDVPDVRQDTSFSCGAAALEAVLAYFGHQEPESELRRKLGTEWLDGTHQDDMAAYARRYGLEAMVQKGLTPEEVERHLSAGRPIIALIHAYATGHYVVICGLDPETATYTIQDPNAGRVEMPIDEFFARWVWVGNDNVSLRRLGVVIGKRQAAQEGRQPPAPQVVLRPQFVVQLPEQQQSAPVVNVQVNPTPVTVQNQVDVQPATVQPEITVEAPRVEVTVEAPQTPPAEFTVERDAAGKITGIREE